MTDCKAVVGAFSRIRKTADAFCRSQFCKTFLPARNNLMCVTLMPYIEQQPVGLEIRIFCTANLIRQKNTRVSAPSPRPAVQR